MVFPVPFRYPYSCFMQSEPCSARAAVWALPRSLAATCGIIVIFSSSGYLDVSVHRVPSAWLWIYHAVTGIACRVSPFRHLRITAGLRLPAAFRSFSRLSSALNAKASTLRPFLLNLPLPLSRPGSQVAHPVAAIRHRAAFFACSRMRIANCHNITEVSLLRNFHF